MTNQDKMRAAFDAWASKWSYGVLNSDDDAGRVSRLGAWAAWQAATAYASAAARKAAPGAAQPAAMLTRAQIRDVFLSNGFTIKEGQTDLKEYVYEAAYALLALAAARTVGDVGEPVAHASFAANGNISLWTVRPHDLDGAPAQPLYTWAQMRRLAAAERERCATVCETWTLGPASATEEREVAQACANAIRSGE
jgi:hypothetical protein